MKFIDVHNVRKMQNLRSMERGVSEHEQACWK